MPYLYGVSAQGIQSFIFATGELKEIIGASELVESLSTEWLDHYLKEKNLNDPSSIQLEGAAGKIKRLFTDEKIVKEVVRGFPLWVARRAPGLSVSQGVIKVDGPVAWQDLKSLEMLLKSQRNRPALWTAPALGAAARAPKTGNPASAIGGDSYLDSSSAAKRTASREARQGVAEKANPDTMQYNFPDSFDDLAGEGELAVFHADGNDLGIYLQSYVETIKTNIAGGLKTFSEKLDEACRTAVQEAVRLTFEADFPDSGSRIPFRPLVVAGDDVTAVMDGRYALAFGENFLTAWEKACDSTIGTLGKGLPKVTVCAGIAYAKTSFPFHYSYELAETLCGQAKKASKARKGGDNNPVPSSLMFHRIRSSHVEDWNTLRERELTCGTWRFDFGPYGLNDNRLPKIKDLREAAEILREPRVKFDTGLREWIGLIHTAPDEEDIFLNRLETIATSESPTDQKNFAVLLDSLLKLRAPTYRAPSELSIRNTKVPIKVGEQNWDFTPIYDILTVKGRNK